MSSSTLLIECAFKNQFVKYLRLKSFKNVPVRVSHVTCYIYLKYATEADIVAFVHVTTYHSKKGPTTFATNTFVLNFSI